MPVNLRLIAEHSIPSRIRHLMLQSNVSSGYLNEAIKGYRINGNLLIQQKFSVKPNVYCIILMP
ncbi:hypothetical protein CS542_02295 [Pedobacter sp. IW39]|nr:hypothetical protein CS542_02295 [Pedobacter sp. IW39]